MVLIKNGDGLKINQCFPKIPYSIGVRKKSVRANGINEYKITENMPLDQFSC